MKQDTDSNDSMINQNEWHEKGELTLDEYSIVRKSAMASVPIKGIFNATIAIEGKVLL